jgi:DNA invertase Pin-like site-specific DNA recombinase
MADNKQDKIPVAVYCRVSTKEAEQLKSLKHQEQFFRELFEEGHENARKRFNYADHKLVEVYVEEGRTGTKLSRPEFDRMIEDAGIDKEKIEGEHYAVAGKPKFKRILVKNTSRFARNTSVNLLIKTLTKIGVYIDFVDIGLSTENDTDTITLGVLQLLDEVESRDKSKKTSFGMKQGAKNKNILCTNKIFGYKYYPMPKNRLEIIPKQAEVVRRMFEMYVNEGLGAHRIAKIFLEEGVLNKNGKPLSECTVRGMLRNEKYCGIVARMKYDTGEVFNKHSYAQVRPLEERAEYQFEDPKRMPPIVSKELFYEAQRILKSRVQHQEQVGKKRKDSGIYNGGLHYGSTPYAYKLFCATCRTEDGKPVQYRAQQTKQYVGRKERYYRCVGKMGVGGTGDKKCKNVTETYLNAELSSEKYSEMLAESFITAQRILAEVKEDITKAIRSVNISKELKRLEAEHEKYQAQLDKAHELYLEDESESSAESVRRITKPIIKKNDKVLAQIRELSKSTADRLNDIDRIDESMEELKRRLSEIFELEKIYSVDNVYFDEDNNAVGEGSFVETSDGYGVFNIDYTLPPKKQFTREEVLEDINRILVHSNKKLTVEFKTFAEVEELVIKHERIMTDRTKGIFEELKARGWDRRYCYEHYDFWN